MPREQFHHLVAASPASCPAAREGWLCDREAADTPHRFRTATGKIQRFRLRERERKPAGE